MNVDNNRRFQQTEEKILRSFGKIATQKGIDKVTVSDVCRQAGIHRTTFYGHYPDIVALRSAVEEYPARIIWNRMRAEGNRDIRTALVVLLEFYFRNQKTVKRSIMAAQRNPDQDVYTIRSMFRKEWEEENTQNYARLFGCATAEEARYHQIWFGVGVQAMIQSWVYNGCRETPEELANLISRFYGLGIEAAQEKLR